MKMKRPLIKALAVFLALLLGAPLGVIAQSGGEQKTFKQEELDQMVAPIALYPDSLLTQILMASTYPLEVVQADRWAKQNKDMKGDALTKALEAQPWDPSVRSLVNFPQVLSMMSEKLDWTTNLGDAFLAQQKDVMDTTQKLRKKAQAEGNLKTTKEQVVKVEQETIIIEPANPQVIYVPAYNPTVVYGAWAYPAYPPYPVYPPGYVATGAAFSFMAGAAVGAAWGYAWGNANWNGGEVNVNVNQNTNVNNNIDRSKEQNKVTRGEGGKGSWQHNPEHRKGVSYKDQGTADKFGKGGPKDAQSRDSFRGRGESGKQDPGRDDRSSGGRQESAGTRDTGSSSRGGQESRGGSAAGGDRPSPSTMESGGKQSAFGGADKGSNAKMESDRGQSSRQSASAQSSQRGGGGSSGTSGGRSSGSSGGGRSGGGGGGRGR
jgi:uncharacterized membrane protein YgcG